MKKNELSKLKTKQLKQTETARYKKTFQSLNKDVPNNKRKGGKHQPYIFSQTKCDRQQRVRHALGLQYVVRHV